MQWRCREKRNDQEHHENVSFFHTAKFWMLFFVFEKMSSSIPKFLVMLLAHVGKRSNSCLQMISKIGVFKNFAIFTGKKLCWSLSFIKFQDWRLTFLFKKKTPTQVFFCGYCKIFKSSFFLKTCSLYLFESFIWWQIIDILEFYFAIVKLGYVIERTWQ